MEFWQRWLILTRWNLMRVCLITFSLCRSKILEIRFFHWSNFVIKVFLVANSESIFHCHKKGVSVIRYPTCFSWFMAFFVFCLVNTLKLWWNPSNITLHNIEDSRIRLLITLYLIPLISILGHQYDCDQVFFIQFPLSWCLYLKLIDDSMVSYLSSWF